MICSSSSRPSPSTLCARLRSGKTRARCKMRRRGTRWEEERETKERRGRDQGERDQGERDRRGRDRALSVVHLLTSTPRAVHLYCISHVLWCIASCVFGQCVGLVCPSIICIGSILTHSDVRFLSFPLPISPSFFFVLFSFVLLSFVPPRLLPLSALHV